MEYKHFWITNRSKKKSEKKIKICLETNENGKLTTQNLWGLVKVVLRERFISNTSLPQEIRETTNKWINLTPKATRNRKKRRTPKLVEGKK